MIISIKNAHAVPSKPREETITTYKHANDHDKHDLNFPDETMLKEMFEKAMGEHVDAFEKRKPNCAASAGFNFTESSQSKIAFDKVSGKHVHSFDIENEKG